MRKVFDEVSPSEIALEYVLGGSGVFRQGVQMDLAPGFAQSVSDVFQNTWDTVSDVAQVGWDNAASFFDRQAQSPGARYADAPGDLSGPVQGDYDVNE